MMARFFSVAACAALVVASTAWPGTARADDMHDMHDMHHHHEMPAPGDLKRSFVSPRIDEIPVVRQDGVRTTLAHELAGTTPTVLAFIYTSCTTICPVTSQILSSTQDALGPEMKRVRFVSLSIDPEYDTPQRLTAYARKYKALPQWQHYGGTLADSIAIQKAFGAYRGDKMNHVPLFFVNGGGKKQWLQLDGFPTAEQLVQALHEQTGS